MVASPLLARAVALRHEQFHTEAARDRQSGRAIAGTRTRGGSVVLAAARRSLSRATAQRSWRPRPHKLARSSGWRLARG
jgi:hypothetical protein